MQKKEYIRRDVIMLLLALHPAFAHAEPVAPTGHRPALWAIVLVGGAMAGAIPLLIGKYAKLNLPKWVIWAAAIVVAGIFVAIIGPIIVGFGSMLITGRTM